MNWELTAAAIRDVSDILRHTLKAFGDHQLTAYEQIIDTGIQMVAEDAGRPGSLDRSDFYPGVRLLHLELASSRRGGASHCLYYMRGTLTDGSTGTIILRVLHERMGPRQKVIKSLRDFVRFRPI